jgi:hypothetical protein
METGTPEPIELTPTGKIAIEAELRFAERFRSWLRILYAGALGGLLIADVVMWSHFKTLESKVQSHERRIERTENTLNDLTVSLSNSTKIETIEIQVDGIEDQVGSLEEMVLNPPEPEPPTEPESDSKPTK